MLCLPSGPTSAQETTEGGYLSFQVMPAERIGTHSLMNVSRLSCVVCRTTTYATLPFAFAPTHSGSPIATDWPPLVSVKHSVQKMPFTPAIAPVSVPLPLQGPASAYFAASCLSIWSLSCCAVAGGLSAPLAIVSAPSLFGLWRLIEFASLLTTCQPSGTPTISESLETD